MLKIVSSIGNIIFILMLNNIYAMELDSSNKKDNDNNGIPRYTKDDSNSIVCYSLVDSNSDSVEENDVTKLLGLAKIINNVQGDNDIHENSNIENKNSLFFKYNKMKPSDDTIELFNTFKKNQQPNSIIIELIEKLNNNIEKKINNKEDSLHALVKDKKIENAFKDFRLSIAKLKKTKNKTEDKIPFYLQMQKSMKIIKPLYETKNNNIKLEEIIGISDSIILSGINKTIDDYCASNFDDNLLNKSEYAKYIKENGFNPENLLLLKQMFQSKKNKHLCRTALDFIFLNNSNGKLCKKDNNSFMKNFSELNELLIEQKCLLD